MDVMAAHRTITSNIVLYPIFKELEKTVLDDPFGHKRATLMFYKYIEGNPYYYDEYLKFVEDIIKHDSNSLKVAEFIKHMGYRAFIKALDKVIKIEYGGKTENFPKGK